MLSAVHSVNRTCATSFGLTQCGFSFDGGRLVKATLLDFERLEQLEKPRQFLFVEAGADMTGIDERAALVHAEKQRAEIQPGVPRLGPAADDEFLFLNDLELAPVGRALA